MEGRFEAGVVSSLWLGWTELARVINLLLACLKIIRKSCGREHGFFADSDTVTKLP